MTATFHFVVCSVLAAAILAMLAYRKVLASNEDHYIHLHEGDNRTISDQRTVGHRIDILDKYSKLLSIALGLYLVVLACFALYEQASHLL